MTGKISFWYWNIEDPLEPADTEGAETWFTFTAVRLR
jgi:hypothetical protein